MNYRPRIHLLFTCLVTQVRRDGSFSAVNRAEYLLRTLRSLRKLGLDSASFCISVSNELEEYLAQVSEEAFGVAKRSRFKSERLEYFADWREELDYLRGLDPDLVLLITYEDHALVHGSTSEFEALSQILSEKAFMQEGIDLISVLSHFPEAHIQVDSWNAVGFSKKIGGRNVVPTVTPIGCALMRPDTLNKWFEHDFSMGYKLVAPENYFGPSVVDGGCFSVVPNEELFRHLDGYGHVRLTPDSNSRSDSASKSGNLLGRSRTFSSMKRIQSLRSPSDYLAFMRELSFFQASNLLFRSLVISTLAFFGRAESITRFHIRMMRRFPRIYSLASSAFSHGIVRFAFIVARDLVRAKSSSRSQKL